MRYFAHISKSFKLWGEVGGGGVMYKDSFQPYNLTFLLFLLLDTALKLKIIIIRGGWGGCSLTLYVKITNFIWNLRKLSFDKKVPPPRFLIHFGSLHPILNILQKLRTVLCYYCDENPYMFTKSIFIIK